MMDGITLLTILCLISIPVIATNRTIINGLSETDENIQHGTSFNISTNAAVDGKFLNQMQQLTALKLVSANDIILQKCKMYLKVVLTNEQKFANKMIIRNILKLIETGSSQGQLKIQNNLRYFTNRVL